MDQIYFFNYIDIVT